MKKIFFLGLISFAIQSQAHEVLNQPQRLSQDPNRYELDYRNELAPFTSDACSFFPEKVPFGEAWALCCVKHDMAYWQGGTREEKNRADQNLRKCAVDSGHDVAAKFLFWGPHLFGGPEIPMPWRWGYGWKYNRGYLPLSPEHHVQARENLQNFIDALNDVVHNIDPY